MHKRIFLMTIAALLVCWAPVGLADDGGGFVNGTATAGARISDSTDNPVRAGEYVNLEDFEDVMVDMYLDLFGGTPNTLYTVGLSYQDNSTKSIDFKMWTKNYISADFGYDSFIHNMDHDYLENMQAKEAGVDADGNFVPGGKQIYHTDNDPMGRYFIQYEKFHGNVKVDLPFLEGGQVYAGYGEQSRSGFKQTMTIDHCAFCHVESNAQRIDQVTETWTAGIKGTTGKVSAEYEYTNRDFYDHTGAPERRWLNASHPVNGGSQDEFASRDIFEDVTLPYGQSADSEKETHNAALKVDLANAGTLKGSYTHTKSTNNFTNIQGKVNAYSAGYAVKLNPDWRLTARFLTYENTVDDYFVDLPNFRASDLTNGNLDFDWNRISAANRTVTQGDLNLNWKMAKRRHLNFSWRVKVIDRDAMTQNQTSYLFDGVNPGNDGATLVPSEPYANKTTINRLKLRYNARVGMKGNYNFNYTFTSVDKPYMNPTAACENSLEGTGSAFTGDGTIYYFQRIRYGNGTNQPNQTHQLALRGSYQLSPRTSVSAYFNYAHDKNDDLNVYEYTRDMYSPGINLWTAPSDRLLFTLGWNNMSMESNANLCPPFFDG